MKEVVEIKLSDIVPNRSQPRLEFYDESIVGLAESIKENGLLQPISVRQANDKYELIAGERRYRACLYNGQDTIRAIIYEANDDESAILSLIENIQREGLNPVEEALAMQKLMKYQHLTQAQLAAKLGFKQSTVANKIRLLKLPDYIKRAVAEGKITERHGRALLKVPEDRLEEVFLTVTNRNYNVAKTEEYIKELLSDKKHEIGVSNNANIAVNTLKQAYDMVRKAGIDADFNKTEYEKYTKVVIKIKK